jgi:hypothetical protein
MQRHSRRACERQIPLDLEPTVNPRSESALRAAYQRVHLPRKFSFEDAMSNRALAIGIENLADAMARHHYSRNAAAVRRTH